MAHRICILAAAAAACGGGAGAGGAPAAAGARFPAGGRLIDLTHSFDETTL